jgi:hypothetical protein
VIAGEPFGERCRGREDAVDRLGRDEQAEGCAGEGGGQVFRLTGDRRRAGKRQERDAEAAAEPA